jgi:hypothetical protein
MAKSQIDIQEIIKWAAENQVKIGNFGIDDRAGGWLAVVKLLELLVLDKNLKGNKGIEKVLNVILDLKLTIAQQTSRIEKLKTLLDDMEKGCTSLRFGGVCECKEETVCECKKHKKVLKEIIEAEINLPEIAKE